MVSEAVLIKGFIMQHSKCLCVVKWGCLAPHASKQTTKPDKYFGGRQPIQSVCSRLNAGHLQKSQRQESQGKGIGIEETQVKKKRFSSL